MNFLQEEKTAIFIEGSHLYGVARNLGFEIDYSNFLKFFQNETHVIRAYYYAVMVETDDHLPLKPLTDWLAYNGYKVSTKHGRDVIDASGKRRIIGSMDVDIAVDVLGMLDYLDHVILVTGSSDFVTLIKAVQRKGVRVTVVSSLMSTPNVADILRRQCDRFLDLAVIGTSFTRQKPQ